MSTKKKRKKSVTIPRKKRSRPRQRKTPARSKHQVKRLRRKKAARQKKRLASRRRKQRQQRKKKVAVIRRRARKVVIPRKLPAKIKRKEKKPVIRKPSKPSAFKDVYEFVALDFKGRVIPQTYGVRLVKSLPYYVLAELIQKMIDRGAIGFRFWYKCPVSVEYPEGQRSTEWFFNLKKYQSLDVWAEFFERLGGKVFQFSYIRKPSRK